MADPQRELAPIIEPSSPAVAVGDGKMSTPGIIAAGIALLLVLAVVALWRRRKNSPLRALHRLRAASDAVAAANELAALLRRAGIAPDPDWQADLERLRFGPPMDDASTLLARLCREAETAMRARR